jgi:pimeloyl-ACP methyl ester carboxylesterase
VPTLPAVLLVHGTPGGNDQLQPLARRLAGGGLTVITFSRPGYLGTPITSGAGFDQQADLAAALLDTLEVSEVSVVGISGGGAVALQMTLRHPERVRALAMIAAVTFEPDGIGALADRPPDWQSDLRALRAMYWPDLALRRCGIDDPTERERLARDPGVRHRLRVLFRSLGFSRLTNDGYTNDYLQSELQNPRSYSLDQIEVPTLGIYGTDDTAVPPAHGERLAREIRGARLAVLPGAHAFFVLDEDAVIELLLPVLRSHVGDREHGPPGH